MAESILIIFACLCFIVMVFFIVRELTNDAPLEVIDCLIILLLLVFSPVIVPAIGAWSILETN